ncbi:protein shifted [Caerostris darwini]|uniref:Protein shifted n=2 Tax=Caerostris TaxID=172845 RepID=A0AAV4NXA1_9ARAC|nr:protein shifted [Caerostris darwini]GIY00771.1 protein shifted [Caerostris extrusa]
MEIYAILDGVVLPYILEPNFEKYLPIIPAEVVSVNFTWKAGDQKYFYDFDQLKSYNETILSDPLISIDTKGKVPRKSKIFQVILPCHRNQSGIASFSISLKIENDKGSYLPGTPLRLKLKKQCGDHGPDPECDKKCANGGRCDQHGICQCPKGYMGKYCDSALCYPVCINGGTCVAPGVCACADGYQGPHCEGGMCHEKCLNGGKCIQKDTCECRRGYYGNRCEYSKCHSVPCLNNGRCVGINRCRCVNGFTGNQCESAVTQPAEITKRERCKKKCNHGKCRKKKCICEKGWFGGKCNKRQPKRKRQKKLLH